MNTWNLFYHITAHIVHYTYGTYDTSKYQMIELAPQSNGRTMLETLQYKSFVVLKYKALFLTEFTQ